MIKTVPMIHSVWCSDGVEHDIERLFKVVVPIPGQDDDHHIYLWCKTCHCNVVVMCAMNKAIFMEHTTLRMNLFGGEVMGMSLSPQIPDEIHIKVWRK